MKKLLILLSVLAIVLGGVTLWALSGASDANAPTDVRTIDVSPQL